VFVEIHIVQNFAPSCLNRDDTNSPKECMFGQTRRARLSSQCLKRAIRNHEIFRKTVHDRVGTRTKRVASKIAEILAEKGKDLERAGHAAEAALVLMGFKVEDGNTAVLLYLAESEIARLAGVVDRSLDVLLAGLDPTSLVAPRRGKRQTKLKSDHGIPPEVAKELGSAPSATDAADIALFGRMVAENKDMGIDAACQVAHAISTHQVAVEMDFFTAVDDLNPGAETGAGMMGVVEFNSACFYRYALVDVDQLAQNLGGDRALARDATVAFARASVAAVPTGKQNSMAAHNPPSYVRLKVRDGGTPWSLANAFARPVDVSRGGRDLAEASVEALREHDRDLTKMYAPEGIRLDAEASLFPILKDPTAKDKVDLRVSLPEVWNKLETALV
jgi:CRISPR system Cascade subunit CasC